MKRTIFYALSLILITLNLTYAQAQQVAATKPQAMDIKKITYLEIDASINPATFNYISNGLKSLSASKGDMAVIKLDTPGGLVTTTKEILTLIGNVDFPIVIWITPEGASATSAGAIIASSAHILVMSEGTNIGAATPIGMDGDIKQADSKAKAVNDLVALVRSLSKARGRNPDQFENMISKAHSLDSRDALEKNVIDHIINSQSDLINYLEQKIVIIKGQKFSLQISDELQSQTLTMDAGQQILNIFANPTTAYVLFIIGAALIYFEMQAPGGMIAGAVGAVCLVLAGIGFQVLPLNLGAMGLIILSFILFIVEAYVTSFGIITLAGLASLIFGSLFLFRTQNSLIDLETSVVYAVVGSIAVYVAALGFFLIKTYRKKKDMFTQQMHEGVITSSLESQDLYQVRVNGEIWTAISKDSLSIHDQVLVTSQNNENLTLEVKKK